MQAAAGGLPAGTALVADRRVRLWRDRRTALGGTPWGVVRLGPVSAELLDRLLVAKPGSVVPESPLARAAADRLVERGLAHPRLLVEARPVGARAAGEPRDVVEVVVPVYGRPELLERCLASLVGSPVVVVDDASPHDDVAEVASRFGARLVRHSLNRGPAAARNTGMAATTSPVVAFLDADCVASTGWTQRLRAHFDDARVGVVAPRVLPRAAGDGVLARHEAARSALDMGADSALVRRGGTLGFLPSAALLVRREAVGAQPFDEDLRLGEDVDLVWRLADGGWHVRYEPSVEVWHEMRLHPFAWARRRFEYGTSAADLDARHPGRLAPARVSAWNLAALAALTARRPVVGALAAGGATVALAWRLRRAGVDPRIAAVVVGKGVVADAAAIGHALRREWWPVGWAALLLAPRSRWARALSLAMLLPVGLEWVRGRPEVDPLRYAGLRLVEDAAYGTGVITSAGRRRTASTLLPSVRWPGRAGAPPGSLSH